MRDANNAAQTGAVKVKAGISRFTLRACDLAYAAGANVSTTAAPTARWSRTAPSTTAASSASTSAATARTAGPTSSATTGSTPTTPPASTRLGGRRAQGHPSRPACASRATRSTTTPALASGATSTAGASSVSGNRVHDNSNSGHLLRDQRRRHDHRQRGLAQRLGLHHVGLGGGHPHRLVEQRRRVRQHRGLERRRDQRHQPEPRQRRLERGHRQLRPRQHDHRRVRHLACLLGPGLERDHVRPRQQQPRRGQPLLERGRRTQRASVRMGWRSFHPCGIQRHARRGRRDLPDGCRAGRGARRGGNPRCCWHAAPIAAPGTRRRADRHHRDPARFERRARDDLLAGDSRSRPLTRSSCRTTGARGGRSGSRRRPADPWSRPSSRGTSTVCGCDTGRRRLRGAPGRPRRPRRRRATRRRAVSACTAGRGAAW